MKGRFTQILFLTLLLFTFSCEIEEVGTLNLLTEEIVNVSGERAVVLGRIIAFENIPVEDHGFYFAEEESFLDPIIISLGATERPGRFVGEVSGLQLGRNYFVKAFVVRAGEMIFANTLSFETLNPAILGYEPLVQFGGGEIVITGINLADDTRVFFGDREAEVREVIFGFQVRVTVPPIASSISEQIRVVTRGIELEVETPFRYAVGRFNLLDANALEGLSIVENIYFQQGERFFAGMGRDSGNQSTDFIWEYNFAQGEWVKTGFEARMQRAASDSHTGYFGGGFFQTSIFGPQIPSDNYWHFDGLEYKELPPAPINISDGFGYEIQGQFYIAGGTIGVGSQVYRYDPASNAWEIRPNLPSNVDKGMVHFVYNDHLYWIDRDNNLIQYNPFTAQSQTVSRYPSPMIENTTDSGGFALVMGDKVFIGLYNNAREIWELDMEILDWGRKQNFTGDARGRITGAYSKDGLLYFLRSYLINPRTEFWEFDPEAF
ncbi:hypothetical protein [Arthrospiribacter ruber]|nr:hypothetical protein [Arthrospiribacter ruber]